MFNWFRKKTRPDGADTRGGTAPEGDSAALRRQADLLLQLDDFDGAVPIYREVIAQDPHDALALTSLGFAEMQLGLKTDAMLHLQRVLDIDAASHDAHYMLATLHESFGDLDAAVRHLREAVAIAPTFEPPARELVRLLAKTGRGEEARRLLDEGLRRNPAFVEHHLYLGNMLFTEGRFAEAVDSYRRALETRPTDPTLLTNLGHSLSVLSRHEEAIDAYTRALAIDADFPWAYGAWLSMRLGMCDWQGIEAEFDELGRRIDEGRPASIPFNMLAAPLSRRQQLKCMTLYRTRAAYAPDAPFPPRAPTSRMRIGYFSADFHEHATAYLIAEMLERHDRSRFEIFAFSFGPRSTTPMRARLEKAFDRFEDVLDLSDAQTIAHARALSIDIAVDLKGYTQDCRPGIFAGRAAPVQVNFLGFPGTMGAPFIDYLVADPVVVPPAAKADYSEKIVFMPHSYQPNDSQRRISSRVFTREETGLPEQGFVFCCFNNNYKITPDVFAVWMRLLHAVPGSVMWLLQDNEFVTRNLRTEASARGIDPERIVFAPRVPMSEHLARHALADLFLDTLYCNAHTTASDALWAGLPLLTCMGDTFAARVAGSLLHAVGLPELATTNLADYEALALSLALDPPRLQALRRQLADRRSTSPLFDAGLFTSHLESAYETMWARHTSGEAPDHVVVPRFRVH